MKKFKYFLVRNLWLFFPAFMLPVMLDIHIYDWRFWAFTIPNLIFVELYAESEAKRLMKRGDNVKVCK